MEILETTLKVVLILFNFYYIVLTEIRHIDHCSKNKTDVGNLHGLLNEEVEKNNDLISENRRLEKANYDLVTALNKKS